LALAPGEIAVIGGPYEEYRPPLNVKRRVELEFPAAVNFSSANLVPFHYNSEWEIAERPRGKLRLQVPSGFASAGLIIDGKKMSGGLPVKVFEDDYVEFEVSSEPGRHGFELTAWLERPENLGSPPSATGNAAGTRVVPKYDGQFYHPVYLCGEFDCDLQTSGDFNHMVFSYYNLQLWAPKECRVTLKCRRSALQAGSWAEQGQPFYSGAATYAFDVSGMRGSAILELPNLAVKAEVFLDGRFVAQTCLPPFRIALGELDGHGLLEIKVSNTLANQLEEYRAPSGLMGAAALLFE
jgi:hypothetical protein